MKSSWRYPVRQLFLSLSRNVVVPEESIEESIPIWHLVSLVTYQQLRGIFWLGLFIVEDTLRADLKGPDRSLVLGSQS